MLVLFSWLHYVIMFVKYENLRLIKKKIVLQEEVSNIMDNLDEAVLSKSKHGLKFCNKNGVNILENIENII